jgi:hypothetical protein
VWVAGRAAQVASVNVATMRVTRLTVRGPRPAGRYTDAAWLGRGRLAAANSDSRGRPGGVEVIDTRRRTRRRIDASAGGVAVASGALLVFQGDGPSTARTARTGLRAYRPDGRLRFQALRGERVRDLEIAGRRGYAIGTHGLAVVDVVTGRVISRSRFDRNRVVKFLTPAA